MAGDFEFCLVSYLKTWNSSVVGGDDVVEEAGRAKKLTDWVVLVQVAVT